ncbi:MAG: flagellar type III secretion system pore protein FliP [Ruminococcus sp.]|nr:flagellar type III secretion system pore protein FliP [Ruminococcus sp.]MCM1382625.1 flagellar type III secretion system pore protein FliP [Muribaculaceae bacterium]MCM1479004.1 flagellar type III secretion system pore protein FliP [Muribaculaceae bacterium]
MKKMIFKKIAAAFICGTVMAVSFPGLTAFAAANPEQGVTGIVTTIPNVETSVPQTTEPTQTQFGTAPVQTDENGNQAETTVSDTLPYDEPVTDDDDEADNLLELLNLNQSSTTIDLILLITILSLAPSILVMLTCFTRIIISFSLLRNAMGVQQTPPNQVMIGLALFLTLFIMTPVISEMNEVAYVPYKNGEYTSVEAVQAASTPLKKWMLANTSNDSMDFFLGLTDTEITAETEEEFIEEVSFTLVVPAFILSEIKIGFEIGFLLYIPFLIIDIVVSTLLMSMGMMMLPPTTISVPFKLLLFILCDGWTLLIGSLVSGFHMYA